MSLNLGGNDLGAETGKAIAEALEVSEFLLRCYFCSFVRFSVLLPTFCATRSASQ